MRRGQASTPLNLELSHLQNGLLGHLYSTVVINMLGIKFYEIMVLIMKEAGTGLRNCCNWWTVHGPHDVFPFVTHQEAHQAVAHVRHGHHVQAVCTWAGSSPLSAVLQHSINTKLATIICHHSWTDL